MNEISKYQIPKDGVIDSDWKDDVDLSSNFELVGDGTEKGEIAYQPEGTLVDKSKVINATSADAKEKIIKFRMKKFGERGSKIHSLFKQEKFAA